MTTYSDWIIIPADRKCDLPRYTKVQVMSRTEDVEYAEKNNDIEDVWDCVCPDGLWFKHIFAYRVVQEPVEEVQKYECWSYKFDSADPAFTRVNSFAEGKNYLAKGTATQTTRDGKPYEFHWKASE
jgi:hypothetical protein